MLRIRLSRHGAKKNPHYRVVIAEKRDPRDGRYVEVVGHYSPAMKPKRLKLNMERVDYWLDIGARPSETVAALIEKARSAQEQASEAEAEAKAAKPADKAEKSDSTDKDSKAEESKKEETKKEESKKEAEAEEEGKSETEPQKDDESKAEEATAEA
ncbi:MAG TPA: 30S ribosomal protein S16 [Acidobacteriota bacterium]|nr:30S ribosomal protein S16 [Acidobacteriota bacterium]